MYAYIRLPSTIYLKMDSIESSTKSKLRFIYYLQTVVCRFTSTLKEHKSIFQFWKSKMEWNLFILRYEKSLNMNILVHELISFAFAFSFVWKGKPSFFLSSTICICSNFEYFFDRDKHKFQNTIAITSNNCNRTTCGMRNLSCRSQRLEIG